MTVSRRAAASRVPDRPRLLMVATESGTIAGFLVPFARHFRAIGWRVEAAAHGASSDAVLRDAFDQVHDLPLSRSLRDVVDLGRAEHAIEDLIRSGPDIVHVHTPIAGFLTRVAARRRPQAMRPMVAYTAHGFHFYRGGHPVGNAVYRTAEQVAGRWTDRLVVINDEDEQAALRSRIVPPRRLVRMPGIGIDTDWYAPSGDPEIAARTRDSLAIPDGAPILVVIAELRPRKRVADAIAALARMRHREAWLVIAGAGPEREALERQALGLGVLPRIRFVGIVRDVRPLLEASACLVLPSYREGLARSIMEALALEVPVVASDARGNASLVGSDGGFIVDVGDVAALAAAIDRLVDEPEAGRAMGARGRSRMVERHALPIVVRMHEHMYAEMLTEKLQLSR